MRPLRHKGVKEFIQRHSQIMRSQDLNLDPRPNTEIIHRDARMHSHVHVPIYLYVTYINKIRLVPFERTEH